jgi:hypothetical protein
MFVWGSRWFIRDGALVLDGEPDAFRRTVRPFLRGFRLPYNGALVYRLDSITADELVLVMSDGTRASWTRAPADERATATFAMLGHCGDGSLRRSSTALRTAAAGIA